MKWLATVWLLVCPVYAAGLELVQLRIVAPSGIEGRCRLISLFDLETQASAALEDTDNGRVCSMTLPAPFDFCALSSVAQHRRRPAVQGYSFRGASFECGVEFIAGSWRFNALALSPSRQTPSCSFVCLTGVEQHPAIPDGR